MDERLVVITGASRGLGLAMARSLAEADYRVVAASRTQSVELSRLRDEFHGRVDFRKLNLADHQNLYTFAASLIRDAGTPFALINNAAIAHDGILATLHESQITESVAVNVTGPLILTKYLSRAMLREKCGRIVNISSIIAATGFNGLSVYGATKAAIIGFTKSLARELGRAGITVNAVAPGYLDTDMSGGLNAAQREQIIRRSALQRLTTVQDVASTVRFLLSDEAAAITGTVVTVDSGATS